MEPIAARTGVVCQKCSSSLLRSNVCHRCQQQQQSISTRPAPRTSLRTLSPNNMNDNNNGRLKAQPPPADKSDKPQQPNKRVVPGRKTPPRITERRFRIFQNVYETEDDSPLPKSKEKSLKLQLMSSSSKEQYVYHSESISSSDTILEEHWTESSTLSAITLLRITSVTFDKHPFIDPSYGKDTTKLSFEGPCSFKALSKALEYFPGIHTLEFGTGFFITQDFDREEELDVPTIMELPRIKSLSVNVDVERYDKMEEIEKTRVHLKIISLLDSFNGRLKALDYCNLSIPNTSEVESHLTAFIIGNNSKGEKWVDYAKKQIMYSVDLSSRESIPSKPSGANRKRRADTPGPEVEVTKMLSKEVKNETVALSDSDDEEEFEKHDTGINADDEIEKDGNDDDHGINNRDDDVDVHVNVLEVNHPSISIPNPSPLTFHGQVSDNSPQQVITLLSDATWRKAHKGEWGSFYCKCITIGHYERFIVCPPVANKRTMRFSAFGIYFEFPHFTQNGTLMRIGIPFEDITRVTLSPNVDPSKSAIFLVTNETTATRIRELLGMSETEEDKRHRHRRHMLFDTERCTKNASDLFTVMYRSKFLLHDFVGEYFKKKTEREKN